MLRLKGGRLICPRSGLDEVGDVLIDDDRIVALGEAARTGVAEEIDCTGCLVAPGFVDLASDFADPGAAWREDLGSGSRAAAAGGFTTVVISPNTHPAIDDPAVVAELMSRAISAPGARVAIAGALTAGLAGVALTEMGLLLEAGCVALSDGGALISDAQVLRRALQYAAPLGVPVLLRPGEVSLEERGVMHEGRVSTRIGLRGIPAAAEEIGVTRAIALVRQTGARVHLTHVTTAAALAAVRHAQAAGLPVSAAVPARQLLVTDALVETSVYDTVARLLPPLRPESDRLAMIEGARALLCVGADHVPWSRVEKEQEFRDAQPGGIGLETAASAVWMHIQDPGAFVEALSTRPAAVLGRDARLTPGSVADVVVFDPEIAWTASGPWISRSANEPLSGQALRGRARATVVGGRVVFEANPA